MGTICGYCNPSASLAQSIFENISISPQLANQPVTMRGISGGSIPARQISQREDTETGPCVGFVDQEPDHTMNLTSFFDFLSLQIKSPEDTTIVIKGPGGIWCNDDAINAQDPGISGQWLEGMYEIWVGSYQRDKYHPYVIEINQDSEVNASP